MIPTTPQDDMYKNRPPHRPRLPRRILPKSSSKKHRERPVSFLSVEPRAFQEDHLPSTPQLNAIMDRAMGKVKSMVKELEHEKGMYVRSTCINFHHHSTSWKTSSEGSGNGYIYT